MHLLESQCTQVSLTLQTDIWLVVRVPVLSEQMTEVQPRVSTDGRERTIAFLRAMRRVPSARHVVMTAGRPLSKNKSYEKRERKREERSEAQRG